MTAIEYPATNAQPELPAPRRVGWWDAILAVIGATIVTWGGMAVVLLPLAQLNLVPITNDSDLSGSGWPWRVDGAWSVVADLGPLLAVGFLFSAAVAWLIRGRTGVRPTRWPLALLVALLGWIPIAGDRPGLLGASGGLAFVVTVIAARSFSGRHRRGTPLSGRQAVLLVAVFVVVAAAVSIPYGALHPLLASTNSTPDSAPRKGGTELTFSIENQGPLGARLLDVRPTNPRLRVTELRTDGDRAIAPSFDGLFKPLGHPVLTAGTDDVPIYMTLARPTCPADAAGSFTDVGAVDVRMRVAGRERTQRLDLPSAPSVACRS